MPWQVEFRAGVWLPQIGWWLDAHFPQERAFVSHAHSDHIAPHGEILCSLGTSRLMQARMPGERVEHVLPFGQTEQLTGDCAVTLHPAGHIFGSAQSLLAHEEHGTLLYTGDFKLRKGRSAEACATPQADVLIMETTFGRPQYVFPPTDEVLHDIAAFCQNCLDDGETPVLFGYSLGKSQELLSGLTEAKLPIMLHPQTLRLTRIYEELGLHFPPHREFNADEVAGHVVICPPQQSNATFLKRIGRRRTAVITGWAMDPGATYRYQCDAAFPLSDHADFLDLLRFVDAVKPKRVLTLHGFAREFAQTLRDRGVESWAIGEDNQLEFGLGGPSNRFSPATAATASAATGGTEPGTETLPPLSEDSAPAADRVSAAAAAVTTEATSAISRPCEAQAANCFARFARIADQVRATPKKLEKIELLRGYLAELPTNDAALAALFFTARAFPQSDGRVLAMGWSVIKRAVLEVAGLSEADYRAAYHRFADAGDAAEALLQASGGDGRIDPGDAPPTCLSDIADLFAGVAAARGPAAKLALFEARLRLLSPGEAKYLVKIITGDLRIGLKEGLVEEAIAAAAGQSTEAVREANMLCGDIAEVTRAARENRLAGIQLRVFNPLQFMLASPEPTAEAILARLAPPVWLEEKYDGIRCQVHKHGNRAAIYSRDLKHITEQFPDIARAALELPRDFIIDGELLAWRDGRALPFAELQKRLGRKGDDFFLGAEIPVSVSCYDLLWIDGRSLLKEPLRTRRELLAGLLNEENAAQPGDPAAGRARSAKFLLAPVQQAHTPDDIEAAFLRARQRGNEGLMAKDPQSAYTPGRRGLAWLKLKKAYATLDVVVVGVEYGHGKRRDVLSDYTFAIRDPDSDRLLTVGKAYSGLTDVEIARMTEHFLASTLEVRGRFRVVVPDTVIEVAFDTIQPSTRHQSGFALRFPRIARIRTDKTPAEIDTLETCRKLAAAAGTLPAPATPNPA
jgi:DNA ligase-1